MCPKAKTHHIAVLKQDNGELAEDVVSKDLTEAGGSEAEGQPERQSEESFPASDPPSTWSGPGEAVRDRSARLVDASPVEDVAERPVPDAPIPRTLPRSEGPGQKSPEGRHGS